VVKKFLIVLSLAVLGGCTTVRVNPVPAGEAIRHVCIEENPKVVVGDFLSVLEEGFARHEISTELVQAVAIPESCEYLVRYTAFKKWDFATYLSHAELRLLKGRNEIASAMYHLKGGGGYSMTKWRSTQSKMDPVIDELLGGEGAVR
jgi:hypothetical protein